MTSLTRRHYVLAKDYATAFPYLQELRKIGFRMAFFLSNASYISDRSPEELAFIFVPDWDKFENADNVWFTAAHKIKQGAIVKSVPQLPPVLPKLSVGDYVNSVSMGDYTSFRITNTASLPFTDDFINSRDQVAKPEKLRDHVFIGGPYNGWKFSPISAPDGKVTIQGVGLKSKYMEYEFTLLGETLTFWVLSSLYGDRQRLVREYLLKNLGEF